VKFRCLNQVLESHFSLDWTAGRPTSLGHDLCKKRQSHTRGMLLNTAAGRSEPGKCQERLRKRKREGIRECTAANAAERPDKEGQQFVPAPTPFTDTGQIWTDTKLNVLYMYNTQCILILSLY